MLDAGRFVGDQDDLDASCAVIDGYESDPAAMPPLVTKFSFNCKVGESRDLDDDARKACQVFGVIKGDFSEWLDPQSPTKNAYAYSRGNPSRRVFRPQY